MQLKAKRYFCRISIPCPNNEILTFADASKIAWLSRGWPDNSSQNNLSRTIHHGQFVARYKFSASWIHQMHIYYNSKSRTYWPICDTIHEKVPSLSSQFRQKPAWKEVGVNFCPKKFICSSEWPVAYRAQVPPRATTSNAALSRNNFWSGPKKRSTDSPKFL